MPQRESAAVGAPCWVDVMSSDPDKTRAFYGELFGWTSEEPNPELGGYFNFGKDGTHIAGGMTNPGDGMPDVWSVYLATRDAAKTAETATGKGSQVLAPVMDVMDLGTMAVITDPGQAVIGMWRPGTHKGFGFVGEPATPSWFELHTRDYDAVLPFYRDVFGVETRTEGDAPDFRYTVLVAGGEDVAGIMDATNFLPDGVPAHWSVYFGSVDNDTDKTLAKVIDLGGSIIQPAEDTPYGRLAQAADPTGALFKLVAR
jgi:uncharacterized protein